MREREEGGEEEKTWERGEKEFLSSVFTYFSLASLNTSCSLFSESCRLGRGGNNLMGQQTNL